MSGKEARVCRVTSSERRRAGLTVVGLSLASLLSFLSAASAPAQTWVGGNGNWNVAANWTPNGVPTSGSPTNTTAGSITFDTLSVLLSSFISSGAGGFTINGGTFGAATPGVSTLQVNGNFTINGGTLSGFVVNANGSPSANPIHFSGGDGNLINNITSNVNLDLTGGARTRVSGGLTLNGVANIGGNGIVSFFDNQTLGGTGAINFATADGSNRLTIEGNSTLTVGTGMLIHGNTGIIGQAVFVGGTGNIINQGTINADVSGGTLALSPSGSTTNTGLLAASNGGQLRLDSAILNTGGNITVQDSASTITQNGMTITGGTINNTSGGHFTATGSDSNGLSGVTLNGVLDLTGGGRERISNGLTLTPTSRVDIGGNGIISFFDNQTLGGTGAINFATADGSNRLTIEGNSTLTVGANILIHGNTGIIGTAVFVGGTGTLINQGTINADVNGGTLTLAPSGVTTNTGLLAASNGGQLLLNTAITNTGGNITVQDASSHITQNGMTITGGTINNTAGGQFTATGSDSNALNGVTVNGVLGLTGGGRERISGGLTLNGTANIGGNGILSFFDNQTLGGNGTVNFASADGSNRLTIEGNSTLTIGANMLIHGNTGLIGQAAFVGGTGNLINNGTIRADVNGGTLTINPSGSITNNGLIAVSNGGQIALPSNITLTNTSGNITVQDAASTITQNAITIVGGTINNTAGGTFRTNGSDSNGLNGVTLNGVLDLTGGGRERISNGLVLSTSASRVDIGGGGILSFFDDQTLSGNGAINFTTTDAGNRLTIEGNSTLTIGAGMLIHGNTGSIGQPAFVGGTGNLINNGTINADVNGGVLTINPTGTIVNHGVIAVSNGGQIVLPSNITLTNTDGSITVQDAASSITQNAITIVGGTITSNAGGHFKTNGSDSNSLSGVTINGVLDLTGGGRERISNGLTLSTATSRVDIGGGGILSFFDNQTLSGSGAINFATADASNRLTIEGNSTLTIEAGMLIHGNTGSIGQAAFIGGTGNLVNNGTINADVSGGVLTINPTGTIINHGVIAVSNGGQIVLPSNITLDNSSGSLTVQDSASTITQNAITIVGGTINSTAGGRFNTNGSDSNSLSGVTVNGVLDLTGAGRERISNGLTLASSTSRVDIGGGGILSFFDNQTLGGTGAVNFATADAGNRLSIEGNATLTIGSEMLIHGNRGSVGAPAFVGGTGNLINNGTISADVNGGRLDVNPTGTFSNTGTIKTVTGATLATNQSFTSGGASSLVQVDGTLAVSDGTGTLTMTGGILNGNGTIQGTLLANGGTVSPGNSPGKLSVTGNATLGAGSIFLAELGGTTAGTTFDLLQVGGTVLTGGTLQVQLVNGYAAPVGSTYTFLLGGRVDNTTPFTIVSMDPGYLWSVNYTATDATLQLISAGGGGVTSAPEAGTFSLFAVGIGALGVLRRRRGTTRK